MHFNSSDKINATKSLLNLVDDEATAAHGPHEGGGHFLFLVGNLGPGINPIKF